MKKKKSQEESILIINSLPPMSVAKHVNEELLEILEIIGINLGVISVAQSWARLMEHKMLPSNQLTEEILFSTYSLLKQDVEDVGGHQKVLQYLVNVWAYAGNLQAIRSNLVKQRQFCFC